MPHVTKCTDLRHVIYTKSAISLQGKSLRRLPVLAWFFEIASCMTFALCVDFVSLP
jgi:hypothetical protein